MQKGLLIKDGSDIKAKEVYAGDISDSTMQGVLDRLQAKYPTLTLSLFNDDDPEFMSAVVNSPFPSL